ncbi:hypothetical protein CCACVL1_03720 [Corchorus capsularis]|uniref:Uncharacterized protein n=1 Tax=Corchorus capsularis TaxID=210143 RepID=A0A1R3JXJ1_COCAP|nr:hypothetical protein CCACVL1_03720 [Corchorus capsularis]
MVGFGTGPPWDTASEKILAVNRSRNLQITSLYRPDLRSTLLFA